VQRGIAIKVIQKNSFTQKVGNNYRNNYREKFNFVRKENDKQENESKNETKEQKKKFQNFRSKFKNFVECWQCGAKGHYRSDCPSLKSEERGN